MTTVATIVERMPNEVYRIRLDDGHALVRLSGKLRMRRSIFQAGDRVEVELNATGGRGRIVGPIRRRRP